MQKVLPSIASLQGCAYSLADSTSSPALISASHQLFHERWARLLTDRGSQPALHLPERTLSLRELDAEARAQVPRGEVVIAQGETPEILRATLSALLHDLPVQWVEKDRERRLPSISLPSETAFIKQTVGGSGVRRCQFFTFEQIAADVDRLHAALDLAHRGVAVAAISCAHSYGLTMTVLQTLLHGVPLGWAPQPFAQPLMEALRPHARAYLPSVPAMWKAWLMGQTSFQNVSLAISAGSPLTPELAAMAEEKHALALHDLYGTSECGAISLDGMLLPEVRAVTSDEGRLHIESSSVGLGYDERLPGEIFGEGQFLTCDAARLENERLHLRGSLGRGINVAGRKLSPDEIAAKIRAASDLTTVEVFGAPSRDPERCQDIVARVPLPQAEISVAFKTKVCAALAPWEVPRRWLSMM
jgi:long-chain acyl-CoA synthetase